MKNLSIISKRFRDAFAPALIGAVSLLFAATSASGQNVVIPNPISWYTLNGNGTDQGSAGAEGALSGTASFVNEGPGIYNQSLSLGPGRGSQRGEIGDDFVGLNQLTITFWINAQGGFASSDRIVSNWDGNTGFDLRISSGGSSAADGFKLGLTLNGSNGFGSDTIVADNTWTFVAVTYSGQVTGNRLSFFVGSELDEVGLLSTASQNDVTLGAGSSGLFIGAPGLTVSTERTPPAWISDVRIFGEALDIQQLEGIRTSVIPEPAHFAAIFGGIILAVLYLRRRKS